MLRSKKRRQKQNKNRLTQKRLGLESLEDRRLMAVDISLTDGLLHIEGDSEHDVVKVMNTTSWMSFGRSRAMKVPAVQVWHGHQEGGRTVFDGSSNFFSFSVDEIFFSGNDGNDLFDNQTSIKSEAHGGFGVDMLKGGSNHDKLFGEGDGDYLYGNAGNDYLVGGGGFDRINGGDGNDTLRGSGDWNGTFYNDNMHDYLMGGDGYDKVVDEVLGNANLTNSYLKLSSFSGNVVEYNMLNSIEAVTLTGNGLDNTIDAGNYDSGKLVVDGGKGDDSIVGSKGNDVLRGGDGDDNIVGMEGNDLIVGQNGDDILVGSEGHDIVIGGYGNDNIGGDEGNDWLVGSHGNDTLNGGTGNDTLSGGAGDDNLSGNDGADKLFGGTGDDQLRGNAGADQLLGGSGNDILYGGTGDDALSGQAGDDGLFGGGGDDTLNGGSDQDRFLTQAGDVVTDKAEEDAQIYFVDMASWTVPYNGATIEYTGGSWTDEEIELIDQALHVLHHTTGKNTLLKLKNKSEMTYQRVGTSDTNFTAWNGGSVHTFADGTFTGNTTWVLQTVFHEIGHNWDKENANWDDFKALSSWTQTDKSSDPDYSAGGNGGWYYKTDTGFVRDYAKTNPKEDFACTFAAYFMDKISLPYLDGGSGTPAPDKMAFMDQFVTSLT